MNEKYIPPPQELGFIQNDNPFIALSPMLVVVFNEELP